MISSPDDIAAEAIQKADELLAKAHAQQTRDEAREGAKMARLMEDPEGKAFTYALVDEVFRSHVPAKQAQRYRELLAAYGVPHYPPLSERALMRLGALASRVSPAFVLPHIAHRMRTETERVIVDGAPGPLQHYLESRKAAGFRINLNHLGEAVLGEEEAAHRLNAILAHLADPHVTYISVKISAIFSQINLLAWSDTLGAIKDRLRRLYRAAMHSPLSPWGRGAGGEGSHKFVNLDMEEYRDLALTLAAFREVLDEPEFFKLSAGVVLQAYLPDSWQAQRDLTEWAKARVARGGVEIKLRLVKGANLAMESVEAELHGWQQAPYSTKTETDANFRRMLEFGSRRENAAAVRLGVASHNLFDVALAMVLRERNGTRERVELEMLEGMANHQARAVRDAAGGLLLYAPAVQQNDFLSALAYLIRRLDENTARDNFLRDMFALQPGSDAWERQRTRFVEGWTQRESVSSEPRRASFTAGVPPASFQSDSSQRDAAAGTGPAFQNVPDSDWTQPATREALWASINSFSQKPLPPLPPLNEVLARARAYQPTWEKLGTDHRAAILRKCARVMSAQRFAAIACMRLDAKKAIPEADSEVSEAIDFARYYATSFDEAEWNGAGAPFYGIRADALGVVVVAPPWNFPYAIPAGGVLAALMAGNAVILKPAPETVGTAWLLAQQLWEAGVPRDALQFYPCADGETGRALITDPRVNCVVLTGAYETARLFQSWRPDLHLLAETSGKNAVIITAQADRELAIKDLVKSAFSHSGQKCSAASLAILEAEVYDDPTFRRQLRDAVASLAVGPSTDPRSVVTPLIREPGESLRRALTTNDAGETWLLEPQMKGADPCLWSPGIKLGVQPNSWFHRTECFGPVLGLMRAESLEQAIQWQNATDYGLTAGLHSLDPAEQKFWREHVQAGNLYLNRPTTGAIVRRQPFGGWKRSCIGPGAKAGGPNYVFSFCKMSAANANPSPPAPLPQGERGERPPPVERSYGGAWVNHFGIEHDPSALRAESNDFRYRPSRGVILRLDCTARVPPASLDETIYRAKLASQITGVPLELSLSSDESDDAFIARLPQLAARAEFLRMIAPPSAKVLAAAHAAGLNWIDAPFTASGRVELRYWLREQAVSQTRHRYGQVLERKA
ncbi:MAG TPA: bifunctional proline dehydrogenase/L-glutamate gamma-semialdehyde dehydrogenase [Planctomycetota bacterium]|nr:bifunctional proline dehydrogenase/L-glutamate gamma-semialdehyde dehydrogenase [Planctomycetota bacterium]